jgi:hypothetical protein
MFATHYKSHRTLFPGSPRSPAFGNHHPFANIMIIDYNIMLFAHNIMMFDAHKVENLFSNKAL